MRAPTPCRPCRRRLGGGLVAQSGARHGGSEHSEIEHLLLRLGEDDVEYFELKVRRRRGTEL